MARKNNVVKFRPQMKLNIGLVIFGVLFIYMIIIVVRSINTDTYAICEVEKSYIDTNIKSTGLAIRQEKLINSSDSGYISYYIRDGQRVAKQATVYTIDETGSVYDTLADLALDSENLDSEQYTEIRNRISMFSSYYNDTEFMDVYNFKYDLENIVLELSNEILVEKLTSMDAIDKSANTFKEIKSEESGIITYYQDNFESYDMYKVTSNDFDKGKYTKTTLKTGEIIGAGTPVYKLVTSENWNIIMMISDVDAERLAEKERVTINIASSTQNVVGNIEIVENNDQHFAIISLDKLMINYLNDRFLDIEIIMDQNEGLKIPNTAIYEKEVYTIPEEYLTAGSNSSEAIYFNIRVLDENGEVTIKQIAPTIFLKDEGQCYVNPDDFDDADVIVANDSQSTLPLSVASKTKMTGVLCVNKGVANFKVIEIIYSNDDFTIIRPNVDYGINLYDRIILDSTTIEENEIIR